MNISPYFVLGSKTDPPNKLFVTNKHYYSALAMNII